MGARRTLFVSGLIAFGLVVAPAPARAHTNTSQIDLARGTGTVTADALKPERIGSSVSFDASGARGSVSGYLRVRPGARAPSLGKGFEPAAWDGRVTCLHVDGKLAILGGTMRAPGSSSIIGRFALLVRNTIDMDLGEDPALLRYGSNVGGSCSMDEFDGLPVSTVSISARVHDGTKDTIDEQLPIPL